MNGVPCVQIGKVWRIPTDPFLSDAQLTRESLPAELRDRLFLTITEAANLLSVDPRTLRRSLKLDEQRRGTGLRVVSDQGRAA